MANIQDLLGDKYREGMTNDEIVEALSGVSLPQDRSDEIERLKKATDKATAEASEYKKKLKERMSEEEKRSTEEAEKYQQIAQENELLRKQITVSDLTAKFMASGMDQETATASANASYEGKVDVVIANYTNLINSAKEKAKADTKAELLAQNPVMKGGSTGKIKDNTEDIQGSVASGDYAKAVALARVAQEVNQNN